MCQQKNDYHYFCCSNEESMPPGPLIDTVNDRPALDARQLVIAEDLSS